VRWRAEDELARPYPVGVDTSAGGDEVTVARANLVPAHHGRLVDGAPGSTAVPAGAPGTFSLVAAGFPALGGPGVALRADGVPYRLEVGIALPGASTPTPVDVVASLLTVPPATLAAVLDVEDDEPPLLRFATGAVGLAPPLGSEVSTRYEVGGGPRGNVAANALRVLSRNTAAAGQAPVWEPVAGATVRNPVAAAGGVPAMPLDVARRDAPEEFAVRPRRAVLAADHATIAAGRPGVQRAVAQREWAGSWPLVRTVVDVDAGGAEEGASLQALLDDVRMLGTEVTVQPGAPVGLLIGLEVCAGLGVDPQDLLRRILVALRPGTAAVPGLFHPSRLTLGGALHVSTVLAAVARVPGVDAVEVREARRLSEPAGTVHMVVTVGPDEVVVLDDDPDRPHRGRLDVRVRGGR
jgi:hypothetical protein